MSWTKRARVGGRQFIIVASSLAVVLLLAVSLMWSSIMEQYYLTVVAPPLERQFGFRAAYVQVQDRSGTSRAFEITELESGGRLAAAGFRVGDILEVDTCRYNGDYVKVESFLDDLTKAAQGETVSFHVARREMDRYDYRFVGLGRGASARQSGAAEHPSGPVGHTTLPLPVRLPDGG